MATPSSIADLGRAFDIGSSRGGFATNMPIYPTGYGAPYAPKDPYSAMGLQDANQIRSIFNESLGFWGNRLGQSIGSMADPFNQLAGRFKTFEDYLREIRDSLKTAPAVTTPSATTPVAAQPPPTGVIAPPPPAGTLPDLRNPLDPAANLIVNAGNIVTDLSQRGVGPGVTTIEDTVAGGGGTNDLLGLPANVTYLGGDSAIEDTGRPWIRTPGGWMADPTWQAELDAITDLDLTVDPGTVINLADVVSTLGGGPAPDTIVDDTVMGGGVSPVGGGGDDLVVDATTGQPIDATGLGQTIVTLGQGLDAAGNVINIVQGIQNEDPTQSIAGLIGLAGNPAVLDTLGIPNVVPGTTTPQTVLSEGGEQAGITTVEGGGVPLTAAANIASGLLAMGSSLASGASDEDKAFGTAKGAAQVVGGVASIMGAQGVAKSMPYVYAALSIAQNAFSDKPADQQAIEAALDVAGAALAGPSFGMSIFAAQVFKMIAAKAFHDVPHRVREALETSNIGRVVSTAISAIEQAETADELHAVAMQGNFGENDWIVAIPMTAGADPRETLDLLSGDPTANVQAGVLDQFKDPMNRAVAGMLKRQATLIRAAESFTANSPTPGRQYLASDVDYFMRNIERFDGEPYDALDAAQVERVVGQHLMEVFRRQGGGWYGPWLDPNLVYNQQGLDEPLRRRGVSEEDIEAARQLFVAKAPGLTEVQYSQDPAQAMAELTGLPVRTTRYFVQGAAGPNVTTEAAAEPIVAQLDGETGMETEEQRADRLYQASIDSQQGGG